MVKITAEHQVYTIILLLRMVSRQNPPITISKNIKQKEEVVEAHTSRSPLITDYEKGFLFEDSCFDLCLQHV